MAATNFREHTICNVIVFTILASLYVFVPEIQPYIGFMSIGFLIGTLYSPDVDMASKRNFFSSFKKNPIKSTWRLSYIVWVPYSWFSNHRGFSHQMVFGTLSRVLYLIVMFLPFFFIAKQQSILFNFIQSSFFIYLVIGWIMADISHILLDHAGSFLAWRNVVLIAVLLLVGGFTAYMMYVSQH